MTIARREIPRTGISITLDLDVIAWLDEQSGVDSRSEFINSMCRDLKVGIIPSWFKSSVAPPGEAEKMDETINQSPGPQDEMQKIFKEEMEKPKKRGRGRPRKVPLSPMR